MEIARSVADRSVQQEREQNARDLLALLPLERISTDKSLRTERAHADSAVAHRDDFLGMVSHDLRDLLGGIVTSAAMLMRSGEVDDGGASTRAGAERILRHAARMKRLISDLTDIASIDAGKLSVVAVPGNLAPVVSEAVISLRGAATAKGVSLNLPHSDVPLPAVFDADRVLQVMTNIIANAIKFTPAGGHITVSNELVGDVARVAVKDTGPGIAPDLIDAVFQRFNQGAIPDRRGLGLGLYISRTLIEAQRGKIWAESVLGHGTTLTFTLPTA